MGINFGFIFNMYGMNLQVSSHCCHVANCIAGYFWSLDDLYPDNWIFSSPLPGKCSASELCYSVEGYTYFSDSNKTASQASIMKLPLWNS